eukprot:CAMPEP_0201871574 /NCGR_PEP_ID=MMETSP0902-20130614/4476_1 /ASSEMBLY_ACC=CAM_ASM_000551 /TAXON_ID=420261 /ORGANISM="Thalassiosira antarctica, Strain CCMP982" /LENGTH=44 /DNA_ID= /DNA_START= /DNA_END= /DNA_ORIENTATION=
MAATSARHSNSFNIAEAMKQQKVTVTEAEEGKHPFILYDKEMNI